MSAILIALNLSFLPYWSALLQLLHGDPQSPLSERPRKRFAYESPIEELYYDRCVKPFRPLLIFILSEQVEIEVIAIISREAEARGLQRTFV